MNNPNLIVASYYTKEVRNETFLMNRESYLFAI